MPLCSARGGRPRGLPCQSIPCDTNKRQLKVHCTLFIIIIIAAPPKEVVGLESAASECKKRQAAWLPAAYRDMVSTEPEHTIVLEHVLQKYANAGTDAVPALRAAYAVKPPTTLPPGAITQRPGAQISRHGCFGWGILDSPMLRLPV